MDDQIRRKPSSNTGAARHAAAPGQAARQTQAPARHAGAQKSAGQGAHSQTHSPRRTGSGNAPRRGSRAAMRKKQRLQRLIPVGLAALVILVLLVYFLATGKSGDADRTAADTGATLSADVSEVSPSEDGDTLEIIGAENASAADPALDTAVSQTTDTENADAGAAVLTDTAGVDGQTDDSADTASASDVSTDPERAARASNRPEQKEGFLPVFSSADTDEKIIAITVDDCFQINNLKTIVQLALDYDAKLTLFPIGEQAMREDHAPVIKAAWEAGMEIENHTYTHNGLYKCDDETLAKEIYIQNYALSYILGGEYKCHFLRPKGGDARWDQRIHAYCSQMGYYGIANWSVVGLSSDPVERLAPGAIYLFHTTDSDVKALKELIPAAAAQGYRMVTLNEMFGYEDNEFTPCEISREMPEVPALEPYEEIYVELKKGTYSHSVYRLQERLVELGYLRTDPDGCYGDKTQKAVSTFQRKAGLDADGIAGPATQEAIYSDSAPRA